MPVISSIDFEGLTDRFNEYSTVEKIGGVLGGIVTFYVLHTVTPHDPGS
jgi:hypothetical protein